MTDGVGQREDYREHRLIGPELCTEREEKISDIYGEFLYLYEGKRTGSRRGILLDQPVGSQVWQALTWCVGMLLVFVPLSVSLGATRRVEQL